MTLFPIAASANANRVDNLFLMMTIFSAIILLGVFALVVVFVIRFRDGSRVTRHQVRSLVSHEIEIVWTSMTAFGALFIFWFASSFFLQQTDAPKDAIEIHVEAKQWMWKATHAQGARELGSLHVPVNRPVLVYLNSQDVIHSFFVPAFRAKQDVVPGMTTTMWFTPDKIGTFPLFCAEYCGTGHSTMQGRVVVMDDGDFARWLDDQPGDEGLVDAGRALFTRAGCAGCHDPSSAVHAPDLRGVYGRKVPLSDGRVVTANAAYLQDSILQPDRDIVAGFEPIMPDFSKLLDEDEVAALVAYLQSLGEGGA